MDYTALMAKNPHQTRQPDRQELMETQRLHAEKEHKQRIKREQMRRQNMPMLERMAMEEAEQWERMQTAQDLQELLEALHHEGYMKLERLMKYEQEHTN